jgi:carboxyl-terminal processing protease
MTFRSKFTLVILSAAIALYAIVGGWMATRAQQSNDPGAQLRIFESVLYHIQNDYVDEPDMSKVRAGALRGLAYGLDPYSAYLTAEQVQQYRAGDNGKVGIGVELSQVSSWLYVIAPVKGGPAEQAGVRSGDIIEYIDGHATRDISLYEAQQLLKGAPGTEVKLRILRAGATPFQVTVKRAPVKTPAAEARMEAGKVGLIKLYSLNEGEAADVQARIDELLKQGAQKLVLDLRGVAGGSLAEAVRVANYFIGDGVLAQTVGRNNRTLKTFEADPKLKLFDGPAVVLIDRWTAGASEAIAAAFIERKRGDVVGEKSFGAGAEQELFTLRGGDGFLLTTVKWASSAGKPFLGVGLQPTVEVKRPEVAEALEEPEDLTGGEGEAARPANKQGVSPEPVKTEDQQLKKALELLRAKGV